MRLKKISMMTVAAIYAAGAGTAAASVNNNNNKMRSIEITDAILKYNENLRDGSNRSGLNLGEINGGHNKNVHRTISVGANSKVPFKYQKNLTGKQTYIVEVSGKPASLYRGEIAGYSATSPALNTVPAMLNARSHNKLDMTSAAVKKYKQYLINKQDQLLTQITGTVGGNLNVTNRYTLAFNGMAITMTQEQAAKVAALPNVRNVTIEQSYQLHTDTGPKHIGADGLWTGTASDSQYKGEGMVIGVLDTGINSDHDSFAAVAGDGYVHKMPARYNKYLGDCEKAEFASMCNDKLIGIRSYSEITNSFSDPIFPSPRPANGEDYNGHGSHTAATSAGNELFDVDHVVGMPGEIGDGQPTGLKLPHISGVAPRANIIAYQVCFSGDGSYGDSYGGCLSSALLAAIEDAIADGVDVINYSIGSTYGSFPWDSPIELSFLAAREAGVSVSASAGNAYSPQYGNQARGAIDHFSPWLTSVAATSHGREFTVEDKSLVDAIGGNQPLAHINGSGITPAYSGPVVDAGAYGEQFKSCNEEFTDGFFLNSPSGEAFDVAPIVLCERGDIARTAKAINIQSGGAGGLILYNQDSELDTHNDAYAIPGINVSHNSYWLAGENGVGLNAWLQSGSGHRLTISNSVVTIGSNTADYVADFSSRGPNLLAPDVMSPNLAAPGIDVYAAWADEMPFTRYGMPADYAAISGTSMAAPHVAGAMALLSQAHPDWSPAQIQSALMTTASIDGVTRARDYDPFDPVEAGYSDAGSGVINVSRANNAGLLLNESAERYRAANPKNGGNIHSLNLPYFYNDNCNRSCSWIRTVTAATDGTWQVNADALSMEGAPMLELEVSPRSFTLKAGETQIINLKAKVLDVTGADGDSSQLSLLGSVVLTPQSSNIPKQHLPVSVRYSHDSLPEQVSGIIHRDKGHTLTPLLSTDEYQSLTPTIYGLNKAQRHEFQLKQSLVRASEGAGRSELNGDPGSEVIFFDIPEGTKRLVWEMVSAPVHAYTALELGMDINEDEDVQWHEEALCLSYSDKGDYCAINDPIPGRYWAIASNWKNQYEGPKNHVDEFIVNLAIISNENNSNLTVDGPTSNDGSPYRLTLNYDLPGTNMGDTYYGVVGLGSDVHNVDDLGQFAVKLQHLGSDTSISANKNNANVGELIDFTVELAPNLLAGEREFDLTTKLPSGLQLQTDSIKLAGLGDYADGMTIDNNTINISATQASSADTPRHYVYTTNLTDATCRVPYGDDPSFYDVPSYGFADIGLSGYSSEVLYMPLAENGLPHVSLYGNPEKYAQNTLGISPFGFVQFDELPMFFNIHMPLDDSFQQFPDTLIAPLWRGDVFMPEAGWSDAWNMLNRVYAVVTDDHYIFQWSGGEETGRNMVGNDNPDPDAEYNIQTIIATDISFEENTPEIIFAYKSLKTRNDHIGTIGIHGYYGERGFMSPYNGWYNDGFAFDDVDKKVSEGTVICADYRGPEQTALTLSFTARVSASLIGSNSVVTVESQYADSELTTVSYSLATPGNISIGAMPDMSMEENAVLEGLTVYYTDLKTSTNNIEITGEHISAVVNGNVSGSTFAITPDADWHGSTEITVTVHDVSYPSDSASTSFMLTVISDGIDPQPPQPPLVEQPKKSKGASLGLFGLFALSLLAVGRRRMR